ncbi:MAG TPA: hypothetical protein RWO66_10860, partial [Ruminococcus sp.]
FLFYHSLLTFYRLFFRGSKEYFQDLLSSITIGPKNPMSIDEVKYFLLANGLDTSKVYIQKSKSTYQ